MTTVVKNKTINSQGGAGSAHRPATKILAVGGAASKVLEREQAQGITGAGAFYLDTDIPSLDRYPPNQTIQLQQKLARVGTDGRPEIARQAVQDCHELIHGTISSTDIVMIIAGLGGGTGSGAAPTIAAMARDSGAYVIATVTQPFGFEAEWRKENAAKAIANLKRQTHSLLVISFDDLTAAVQENSAEETNLDEVLALADWTMARSLRTIIEINSMDAIGEIEVPLAKPINSTTQSR
ncbi:hypothetical protein M1O29_00615 [Dehalococcoidia bacterium]|nr:hypothetical protein [Dehalococcoidia bacterium]